MLRVTHDIWDEQKDIDACFEAWRKWQGCEQPGFWIDMDMIPFGQLQLMSPPSKDETKSPMDKGDVALAGKGVRRWCLLSDAQKRTFITMRAMAASPLMMGGDLPTIDDLSLTLITNSDMLACNQNGVMGSLQFEKDSVEIWTAEKKAATADGWIGIFNRNDEKMSCSISMELLGLDSNSQYELYEVWGDKLFECGKTELEPNGCLFIRYSEKE